MRDDAFGHRDPFTGEVVGDKDEWTAWDYLIADVAQLIEDCTDENGFLVWEKDTGQEEPTAIIATLRRDRAAYTRQVFEKQNADALSKPGAYVELRMKLRNGYEYPSHRDYFKRQAERFK